MIDRRLLIAASGAALVLPLAARAQAPATRPPPKEGPFRFKAQSGETDAEWGSFEVPEDRRNPKSRRIRLWYVRFPSTATKPGFPIVYLAGGPGGSGAGAAGGPRFPLFMALREVSDVIAFEQRGVNRSNFIPERPLPAPPMPPVPPLTQAALEPFIRQDMKEAWDFWTAHGASMRGYNTNDSADDLDDLRKHLGAAKINLWGISYGTTLGMVALKRHGDRIDRVALASLEGVHQTVKRPAHVDEYFERVQRLFAADPDARAAVPDLAALMRRVHARYEADPAPMRANLGPITLDLKVGGFAIQMLAGSLIKDPDTLVQLPRAYRALDKGSLAPVQMAAGQLGSLLRVGGMPEVMDMASGVSPAKLTQIRAEAKTALLGEAMNYPMPQLAGAIPGVDLGEDFRRQIKFRHRTLLIHGVLDGRTPLEEQAEVIEQFTDRALLRVENAGHDVLEAHPGVQTALVRHFKGERLVDAILDLPAPKFLI